MSEFVVRQAYRLDMCNGLESNIVCCFCMEMREKS